MPGTNPVILRAFSGGEIAPSLAARADLARFQTSARTVRNFLVHRHGGASNRPGTRLVAECGTSGENKRLLRYIHETPELSVLIEAGEGYLRFYQGGALVEVDPGDVPAWNSGDDYVIGDIVSDGGVNYYAIKAGTNHDPPNATYWQPLDGNTLEIVTPFDDPGLFNWHQSGRVITFTHKGKPAYELVYEALTRWVWRAVSTAPIVDPPANPVLSAGAGSAKFGYVVTAAAPGTFEESIASAQAIDATAAEPTSAAPHELSWDAQDVDGEACPEYYVYCDPYGNGTYGFIGTATGVTTFRNPGIEPDFGITPPLERILFAEEAEYPHVSATYQQRRIFAHTENLPDALYGSRVGFPSNFGICSPLQDDDAITFRVAGNNHHPVRHLVALKHGLCIFTDGGEWTARGPEGRSLIPNGIDVEQETYIGAAEFVRPAVVGNGVIYTQARGSKVAEIKFDQAVEGLGGRDLTVFAAHLFDGYTLLDMDIQLAPDSIIWATRSDGTLLGLTYIPEQDVWGWHRHDTDGQFERVCVLPGDGQDDVYFIVRRVINGVVKRFIEKLAPRTILDFDRDSYFLDCGLSYNGAAVDDVAGLDHLNGETVGVVADGAYRGTFAVAGGTINIGTAAENIHVGLLYTADLETLSLDAAGSDVRAKKKRVGSIDVIVDASSRAFYAGRDEDNLKQYVAPSYAGTAKSHTGKVELTIPSTFDDDGRVLIRQTVPLPLTVLAIIPNVELAA